MLPKIWQTSEIAHVTFREQIYWCSPIVDWACKHKVATRTLERPSNKAIKLFAVKGLTLINSNTINRQNCNKFSSYILFWPILTWLNVLLVVRMYFQSVKNGPTKNTTVLRRAKHAEAHIFVQNRSPGDLRSWHFITLKLVVRRRSRSWSRSAGFYTPCFNAQGFPYASHLL